MEIVDVRDDCWNRIGVNGDHSCPELVQHVHCRNCPVFAAAARSFFDRPAPDGYLGEWSEILASDEDRVDRDRASIVIFRLGDEWLGLATLALAEVAPPRPVHRIPHRDGGTTLGLVNIRGQLRLVVSLHGLLGTGSPAPWWRSETQDAAGGPKGRLVVLRNGPETWVFPAEEVVGVFRISRSQLRAAATGLSKAAQGFSQAVFTWRERTVAYLDEARVFEALREQGP